ncbi:unnamed protein product [Brassicogethes aeneus]|uniref:ATP-dependent DNA helicase n=1 Tax=Brassicogethes aeneus TaxID=1431903 RepID=A0A9P0FPI3_BRAAE|nr:unnamed protein product [Brassicogethes aeneus]
MVNGGNLKLRPFFNPHETHLSSKFHLRKIGLSALFIDFFDEILEFTHEAFQVEGVVVEKPNLVKSVNCFFENKQRNIYLLNMPKVKRQSLETKRKLAKLQRAKKLEDIVSSELVIDKTEEKRLKNRMAKRKSRENLEKRQAEREIDKISKRKVRENTQTLKKINIQNKKAMSKKRENKDLRDFEKESDKRIKKQVRKNEIVKKEHNQLNKECMSSKRQDENFRENEKEADKTAKKQVRQSETVKQKHNQLHKEYLSKKRQEKSFRESEKETDKTAKKQVRQNETVKQEHNQLHKEYLSKKRQDESFRECEKETDKTTKKEVRQIETVKKEHNRLNKESMSKKRQDKEFREMEKERDKINKSQQRFSNPSLLEVEAERISQKRQSESYREKERAHDKEAKRRKKVVESTGSQAPAPMHFPPRNVAKNSVEYFRHMIKEGPTGVCTSCLRLCFPRLMSKTPKLDKVRTERPELYEKIFNYPDSNQFCKTCLDYLRKDEHSNYCASECKIIFDLPERFRDLSTLEERLVALRIPFMQIRAFGREKQCSIKGSIVNVPLDTSSVVSVLPRNLDDTQTIQVKLKRRQAHDSHYILETVRPAIILGALEFLKTQPLYANVNINPDWVDGLERDAVGNVQIEHNDNVDDDFDKTFSTISQLSDVLEKVSILEKQAAEIPPPQQPTKHTVESEFDREDENELINPGGEETLLDERDPLANIVMAPGENQIPKHIMLDEYAEEMSFPTIFAGNKKAFNKKMLYHNQAKLQSAYVDRRFARPDFLLFMFKKKQLLATNTAIQLAIRKLDDRTSRKHTVADVMNIDYLKQLIKQDQGFGFMSSIRSAPAYWELQKNKLMAMVRQFGAPTFFVTISAAESLWPELLVILSQVVDRKHLSETEALNLKSEDKCRLIRTDPITCARYFDNRFHLLLNQLKSQFSVFKQHPMIHYYYRVEFQQRGSPHVHMLCWHENAPSVEPGSTDEEKKIVCDFIDQYVTCDSELPEVVDLMPLQKHRHNKSCKKEFKGKTLCRFNFPCLPMDETTIIYPHSPLNITADSWRAATDAVEKCKEFLSTNKEDLDDLTFQGFLEKMGLTKVSYLESLRTVTKKATTMLKRRPKDAFVNNFNKDILALQRSNMDIQYILDAYACLTYIVAYMNKSNRGVSKILAQAMNEVKNNNVETIEQFRLLGKTFLNASEVSAQEAAYDLLQLHMSEADTINIYINTQPMDKRVRILKPKHELLQMTKDDTDVYKLGKIDHYVQRPDSLENVCLARFIAYYTAKQKETDLQLKDKSAYLHLRNKPSVISFKCPGLLQEPLEYYRVQLMLYVPWRDELRELINIDHEAVYVAYKETILANSEEFNRLQQHTLEAAMELAEKNADLGFEDAEFVPDREYEVYYVDKPDGEPILLKGKGDAPRAPKSTNKKGKDDTFTFPTPYQIEEKEFREIIAQLNNKQHEYLNHVLDNVISKKKFYEVVVGGAGVGKSRLIKAIYQSLLRHFNSIPGNNPETIKIMLTAPTGKASFAIRGLTIHSSFGIPVNTSKEDILPLSHDKANTLYTLLSELKLIIIDEFSMVGSTMLAQIHTRLQQIFKNNCDFGDIPIIMFGDLNQLAPVGDQWIFRPNKRNPYGLLCGTYLWDKFAFYELTEIMRQREDLAFAEALNNMASNKMSVTDVQLFAKRQVDEKMIVPDNIIHLFATNAEVDQYNHHRLSEFETESAESVATDIIKGSCPEKVKEALLKRARILKKTECFGLMHSIKLQVEARYMISMNIDTNDGIVNGATGILKKIDYDNDQTPKQIWIEFMDGDVGVNCRKKARDQVAAAGHPDTWTPIKKAARVIQSRKGNAVNVERQQFPVFVAEGITIHKAQGGTYQQVAVHLKPGMMRSALYVACSRATTINGLYIFGKFKKPVSTKLDSNGNELINLRVNKSLVTKFDEQFVEGSILVTYQSVRFLNKELTLIRNNPLFKNANLAIFEDEGADENDVSQYPNLNDEFRQQIFRSIDDLFNIVCFYRDPVLKLSTYVSGADTHQLINVHLGEDNNATKIIVLNKRPNPTQVFEGALIVDGAMPTDDTAKYLLIGKWHDTKDRQQVVDHFPSLELESITTTIDYHAVCSFVHPLHGSEFVRSETHATVHSKNLAISTRLSDKAICRPKAEEDKLVESATMDVDDDLCPLSNESDDRRSSSAMSISADPSEHGSIADEKKSDDSAMSISSTSIQSSSSYKDYRESYDNKGLKNSDGVSCYANATVQCLLSLQEFRRWIMQNADENDACKAIVRIMLSKKKNCWELRTLLTFQ